MLAVVPLPIGEVRQMFTHDALRDSGFEGFTPVTNALGDALDAPDAPGVYAVLLVNDGPAFLDQSVGGWFKGDDPTVDVQRLADKWVDRAETVYIGRASSLHDRLGLLARYGRGEPVAHRGGRFLWQLVGHRDLIVAWRCVPDPIAAEAELLDEFEALHGRLPFANLVRGARPSIAA
jgi:hypothetical protein